MLGTGPRPGGSDLAQLQFAAGPRLEGSAPGEGLLRAGAAGARKPPLIPVVAPALPEASTANGSAHWTH